MTEEIKGFELEDDALESVAGGKIFFKRKERHPRECGSSCAVYEVHPYDVGDQKCCETCLHYESNINDSPRDPSWGCVRNIPNLWKN